MRKRLAMRPYRHGDFDEIEPREDFAREHAAMGWPFRAAPPEGCAWTMTRANAPIACGGYLYDTERKGWTGWLYLSALRLAEWGFVLKTARKALAFADREAGTVIAAYAEFENRPAIRTLEKLGFDYREGDFTYDDRAYVRLAREPN